MLVWVLIAWLAVRCAANGSPYAAYDSEGGDSGEDAIGSSGAAPVDYTRYFASGSAPSASERRDSHDGAGFVQPIDFSSLLANTQLGDAGQAVAASSSRVQDFFRAADADPATSNGTGFTHAPLRFPSLFDAMRADKGFRPQDFLQGRSSERDEASGQQSQRSSPSFSKLDADYRPPSQASYSAARTVRPHATLQPASLPSAVTTPVDLYGSRLTSSLPVSSEPRVGKNSYRLPPPLVDYTAQLKTPAYSPSPPLPSTSLSPAVVLSAAQESAPSAQAPLHEVRREKKCKKIDKSISTDDLVKGRFRRETAMTCYVCEDPKTGGNYEECSYATEPKAAKYFIGHAQSFSSDKPLNTQSYRYRRQASPFTLDRYARLEPSFSADSSYKYPYGGPKISERYGFREEDFAPSHADYSAATSDKNCNKVQKESMTCYVCHDPKTGGSYEQCSYAVEPKSNNYFVARESSFNTGNKSPYRERYRRDDKYGGGSSDDTSKHADRERSPRGEGQRGVGLDPFLYGEPKPYDPKADKDTSASENQDSFYSPYRSYEDYFSHLFPELVPREASASSHEEIAEEKTIPGFQYKSTIPDYFTDTEKKKDLDAVLGEFTAKDRSHCKKVFKDKMTCYQCVDKQGMQHEECMFVAASEPKSQHLAYKEVKEFNLAPRAAAAAEEEEASQVVQATVLAAAEAALAAADASKAKRDALLVDEMLASATNPRKQRRRQVDDVPPTPSRHAPVQPAPPELSELDRSPDGLYSAETRHKFDPVLKVTLPEYMLTRSEHEAIFDEVMASGR